MSIENLIALIAALGIGGVLGAILNSYLERQKQTKEHDLKIFRESDDILREIRLLNIADALFGDHSIDRDDFQRLTQWCEFFEETGKQYLDKRLIKQSQELLQVLAQLMYFIATNFFTIRDQNLSNTRQYLKPDFNIDRGDPNPEQEAVYSRYADELQQLTMTTRKQYTKYRLAIKQTLMI
jgi:hypothetical protein